MAIRLQGPFTAITTLTPVPNLAEVPKLQPHIILHMQKLIFFEKSFILLHRWTECMTKTNGRRHSSAEEQLTEIFL